MAQNLNCTYCGSKEHPKSYCPQTALGQSNRLHLRCSYCGGKDHNYEACTKHFGGGAMANAVRIFDR